MALILSGNGDITGLDPALFQSNEMGYTPAGTGAVATTVQAKLRESVSVLDFGAVGDGVTDDTAAIQAALNSGVPYVLLPPGTYLVTATLTIASANITLAGQSGGTQAYQTATINHLAASTGPLFLLDSASNGGACLRNFNVTGGNGSFCIVSSRPYVRYEYIHMEPYNGGGIQLLGAVSGSGGSSSSTIKECQWVGPPSPTAYTGFEIDVNGGDVELDHVTAIRGAIGINVKQGQTILIKRPSCTKQTRNPFVTGGAFSSATQFNTCGIKLSGTGPIQAATIEDGYIEVCDNGIYVVSVEVLTIKGNWIDDGGAAGTTGAWKAYGNSAITLVDTNVKNVTIIGNNIHANSASDIDNIANRFYALRFNNALNVILQNNYITTTGDYSALYYLTSSPSIYAIGNTHVPSISFNSPSYDPSALLRNIVSHREGAKDWVAVTPQGAWVNSAGAAYYKDQLGFVHISGGMSGGAAGTIMFILPVGFRPRQPEGFGVTGDAFTNAVVQVATNGEVIFRAGTAASGSYLSGVSFSVI